MLHSIWFTRFIVGLQLSCLFPRVSSAPTDIPSAASFYVPSIPDVHWDPNNPLRVYSGHIAADPDASNDPTDVSSHLFFVLVKNRRVADKQRIIFWFNGGPGCSSFDGLMMEVGPWRLDPSTGTFQAMEGGWEEYTTMVFLDQPAGTGYSYVRTDGYVHDMDQASKQFLEFVRKFYLIFPEYKNVDTYLAGESFAGQWIPYYADAILNSHINIPLRGIAIGNGWIDPRNHYPSYLDFAVKVGVLEENSAAYKEAKKITDECVAEMDMITNLRPINVEKCSGILLDVFKVKEKIANGVDMCVNIYDVRLDDISPACGMNWPPDIKPITKFLGRPDVVSAFHASAHPGYWTECKGPVHTAFRETSINASITILPSVVERIPVLLFAGDQDIICNYIGIENMIKEMTWSGETGLGTVQTQSWNVNGSPAGTWVSSRNLTYAKIFNASHMAPYDLPHVSHDMILRFMGVNFSAIVDGSARIPSSIGTNAKPIFVGEDESKATASSIPAKTPEQDKAMWEAYYNAGSAALVLLLVFLAIGMFVWCRVRRRRVQLPVQQEEENIPLNQSINHSRRNLNEDDAEENEAVERSYDKGKERAREREDEAPIFDVGDSDEDEEAYHDHNKKSP